MAVGTTPRCRRCWPWSAPSPSEGGMQRAPQVCRLHAAYLACLRSHEVITVFALQRRAAATSVSHSGTGGLCQCCGRTYRPNPAYRGCTAI